jgi:hypothetical protein
LYFKDFEELNSKITLDILMSYFRQAKVIYQLKQHEIHHLKIRNNHLREHHQAKASNQASQFLKPHLSTNFDH